MIENCRISELPGKLIIQMPYKANVLDQIESIGVLSVFAAVVTLFWLSGNWHYQSTYLVWQILLMLITGGIFVLRFLWRFWGKECIWFSEEMITIEHRIFGRRLSSSTYTAKKIRGLFVSKVYEERPAFVSFSIDEVSYKRGRIGFNIGKTIFRQWITIRFGSCLDRQDARELIELIVARFPQYQLTPTSQNEAG